MSNPKIMTMYFNRGAYVCWGEELTLTTRFGIIECERSDRPGWYYVRNEHGDLDQVYWTDLSLAKKLNG